MTEDFIIPLNGLKSGRTEFSWRAGKEFFEGFGNSEIIDADIAVNAEVEKSGTYLGVNCRLEGTLTVPCDRCLEDLTLPVSAEARLSVKFGEEPSDAAEAVAGDEREIIYLPDDGADMDLSQTVYDYAYLALPMQRIHEEGKCNPAVLKYLNVGDFEETPDEGKENGDNPFAVLKGLDLEK